MIYVLNLFGTGIRYWICEIPIQLYHEMNEVRLNHKVEWENLLFDFDFLKHFGYRHWSELSNYPEQTGFLLLLENRIEIKCGAKFITRFRAHELTNEETLFPLYNTNFEPLITSRKNNTKRIILIQYEKGLIGKYQFEAEHFNMNNLNFSVSEFHNFQLLIGLIYQDKSLVKKQDDTIVIGTKVIVTD